MNDNAQNNMADLFSGGGFASLLQNPEVAAKLPRIMEALAPVMAEMKAEKGGGTPPAATVGAEDDAPAKESFAGNEESLAAGLLSQAGMGGKGAHPNRLSLLKALSPYLSPERQNALDYIVKVSALIDVLSEVM